MAVGILRVLSHALVICGCCTFWAVKSPAGEHAFFRGKILPCDHTYDTGCRRAKEMRISLIRTSMIRCGGGDVVRCNELLHMPDLSDKVRSDILQKRSDILKGGVAQNRFRSSDPFTRFLRRNTTEARPGAYAIPQITARAAIPPGVSAGVPPNVRSGYPSNLSVGVPSGVWSGHPYGLSTGYPTGVSAGYPKNLATGVPGGVTTGVPNNVSVGIPESVTANLPRSVRVDVPENVSVGIPKAVSAGVPPNVGSGVPENVTTSVPSNVKPGVNVKPSRPGNAREGELVELNASKATSARGAVSTKGNSDAQEKMVSAVVSPAFTNARSSEAVKLATAGPNGSNPATTGRQWASLKAAGHSLLSSNEELLTSRPGAMVVSALATAGGVATENHWKKLPPGTTFVVASIPEAINEYNESGLLAAGAKLSGAIAVEAATTAGKLSRIPGADYAGAVGTQIIVDYGANYIAPAAGEFLFNRWPHLFIPAQSIDVAGSAHDK